MALSDVIVIILAIWRCTPGTQYSGNYYQLSGLHPGPTPAYDIGIWVGARGPRALQLIGRAADGWVSQTMGYRPPGASARLSTVIDDAAREPGRSPAAIRRIYPIPRPFTTSAPVPPPTPTST